MCICGSVCCLDECPARGLAAESDLLRVLDVYRTFGDAFCPGDIKMATGLGTQRLWDAAKALSHTGLFINATGSRDLPSNGAVLQMYRAQTIREDTKVAA